MSCPLPAFIAAAAFAAVTAPALGQSTPPPMQAVHPGSAAPVPAGPYVRGAWVWHGESGAAVGTPYSGGPYAQGTWAWQANGDPTAGYAYPYGAGANSCGCPGYGYPVTWVQVPVETRYRYSPPIAHDKQVVEERTVDDVFVENQAAPVRRTTKYVKTPAAKIAKARSTK